MSETPSSKISELPIIVAANLLDTDVVPVVAGGITSKVSFADLTSKIVIYPVITGEVGVTNRTYYYGDIRRFGGVGDYNGATGTDNTVAVQNMILSNPRRRCTWAMGNYLVTDTVCDARTALSQSWIGERTERGTDAFAFRSTYSATKVTFRPIDTSKPFFRAYSTTGADGFLGPYEFKNITFDFGDANGFCIGVEDISTPTVVAPANPPALIEADGQIPIFGFRLNNCALLATHANRVSVSGVLTRSGRRMINMSHCFEAVIEDTSLLGCDTQVRVYGCDKPTFRNIRSQWSHLPLDMVGSGNLRVQHTIDNFQVEGWTFTPIRVKDCTVAASNLRLEEIDGAPTGSGRFAVPGTVAVTADSNTLTFSQSMAGILFPYLSIVELTNGTDVLQVLVASVAGATVTFDNRATVCTWTAGAATATRIHGYGPIQMSAFGSTFTDASVSADSNCPAFVYVMDVGQMSIKGAHTASGNYGDMRSMVLGNIFPTAGASLRKLQGLMVLDGCDSEIAPLLGHPFVRSTTYRDSYGVDNPQNQRQFLGPISDADLAVRRKWAWTPATFGYVSPEPIVKIAGETNTSQKEWVWQKRSAGGTSITLFDGTVVADSTSFLRVRYKAQAITGTVALAPFFSGNGGGSPLTSVTLTTTAKIYEFIVPVPAQWQGVRSGAAGINFGSTGYYLFGCTIEEITAQDRALFPAGVSTFVKSGAVADADFISAPANGTLALDSRGALWVRNANVWEVYGQRQLVSLDRGDQDVVLTASDRATQWFGTALTANRIVTLPGDGTKFRIMRDGLGAFTLTVKTAGAITLKVMPAATAAYVDVERNSNSGAYQLTAYGTL